ncbi:MAG: helix-turn-helix domain-containing protein [Beggiatoa sp.]|nr:helix-turn-helix domain-containing protein [Beggiatoa sp.]
MAERGGFDPAMMSKIERHDQNPSLEMLRRIANGLGCSVVDLLDERDKERGRRATDPKAARSRPGGRPRPRRLSTGSGDN